MNRSIGKDWIISLGKLIVRSKLIGTMVSISFEKSPSEFIGTALFLNRLSKIKICVFSHFSLPRKEEYIQVSFSCSRI
jgi:hypothetical protein